MADIIHIEEPLLRGILKVAPLKGSYDGPARNVTSDDMLQPLRDIIDICGTNPSSIEFSTNSQSSEESGRTGSLKMTKDLLGRVRTIDMEFNLLKKEQYQPLYDFFMELVENKNQSNKISVYVPNANGITTTQSCTIDAGATIYCKLINPTTGIKGTISTTITTDGTHNLKLTDYYSPSIASPSDSELTALTVVKSGNSLIVSVNDDYRYTIMEVDSITSSPDSEAKTEYVIWYYIEVMLPESDVPIKEIIYIGDSGFTSLGTFYKTDNEILYDDNGDPYMTKKLNNIYVKNLKVPMIAKNAVSRVRG